MFNSLNISGNILVYASVDSISVLTSCRVIALVNCFYVFVSLARALLNNLRSERISSLSIRGEEA